jgi:hypothetical protein
MSDSSTEPRPSSAQSAADFVAAMRRLKAWSGLSYRQLAKRAAAVGDYLPHSTTAAALGRDTLPREDVVAAFVRACGCDAETVDAWLGLRRRVAVADPAWAGPNTLAEAADGAQPDSGETAERGTDEPGRGPTRPAGSRRRRPVLLAVAGAAAAGLVFTVAAVARSGSGAPPAFGTRAPSHRPASSGPPAPSGPIAQWRFDRPAVTSVVDSSGHGFPLKLNGRTSRISTPAGGALKLEGAGYASTGRPVIRTDEPFTVTAWVRLDSVGQWATVVSQHDQSYDVFLLNYDKEADRWAFMAPDQSGGAPVAALSAAPPRLRKWTHLGAVYDGAGRLRLYVDGQPDGTATCPPLGRAAGVMDIGRALYEGTEVDRLRGAVSEVGVYARALSAAELREAAAAEPRLR